MNKKIIAIVVCAVVAVAGACVAVPLARKSHSTPVPDVPTDDTGYYEETGSYESYPDYTASYSEPMTEPSTEGQSEAGTDTEQSAVSQIISTIKNGVTSAANVASTVSGTTKAGNSTNKNTTRSNTTRPATTNANRNTTKANTTKANTTKANGKTTTTKANTTKKATTTRDPNAAPISYIAQDAINEDAPSSMLGYRYSSDGYYYCDDKDCWQKGVGYNEVYDKWAPVAAMYIDQIRIRFKYENKYWMIQFWKGQYGYLLVGAEIGIYTCDEKDYSGEVGDINHFECADKKDWLYMQLDCYYCKGSKGTYKKIFTRPYDLYWWATGFVKGQLTKYTAPRTELKTRDRITFKSEDQANLFIQGLKQTGFKRAAAKDKLADDTYFQSGKDVWVLWSTKNNDCFVGYTSFRESTTANTQPVTEAPVTTTEAPAQEPAETPAQ